jgi:hypothetical protein
MPRGNTEHNLTNAVGGSRRTDLGAADVEEDDR